MNTGDEMLRSPQRGDRVIVVRGSFKDFEGVVQEVHEASGVVIVLLDIHRRQTAVELTFHDLEPA